MGAPKNVDVEGFNQLKRQNEQLRKQLSALQSAGAQKTVVDAAVTDTK